MKPSIIKVDIDGYLDGIALDERLMQLGYVFRAKEIKVELYRTKKGFHIYAHLDKRITDMELLFCQLFLGSDRWRELFNLRRVRRGEKRWNVLFSVKKIGGVVVSREKLIKKYTIHV